MPTRVVTVRRWEVVAAFLFVVLASVGVALWNDHRIDQAEDRITRNTIKAAQAQTALDRVNEQRAARVREAQARDNAICVQVEALKTAQRQRALTSWRNLERDGRLLGIKITPAVRRAARQSLNQQLKLFRPRMCPPPPHSPEGTGGSPGG